MQDLECVEVFSGVSSVVKGFRAWFASSCIALVGFCVGCWQFLNSCLASGRLGAKSPAS